jgi:outer membrane protein OmpA-like peptidoglycan-associated protein
MKKITILLILTSFFLVNNLEAKPEKFNFGLFLGGNVNMHNPDYNSPLMEPYDNIFVPINESNNSFGFNFGLIGNFLLAENIFISGRLGYHSLNTDLNGEFSNQEIGISSIHDFEFDLSYLEISPMVQIYDLIPVENLYLLGGIELGIPILKEYDRYRNFSDNTLDPPMQSLDTLSTDIQDAAIRLALAVGVGYTFDIAENTYLSPELSFRLPFTQVISDDNFDSWNVPQVRLGVNLTFSLGGEDVEEAPKFVPEVDAGIKEIRYRDIDGTAKPVDKVTVEEVQYQELFPLLPYVFFDEMSVEPTKKYEIKINETQAGEFSVEDLEPNAVKINSRTLDIIGKRMQDNPNARITITGTIDNDAEKDEKKLSELRAKYVKDYLVNNFEIDESRINSEARGLPEKPSTSRVEDGSEENRRVEISTTNQDITAPIIIEKDRQRLADPELIEFIPYFNSNDSIVGWSLQISQSGKQIRKYEGVKPIDRIQWNIMPNELAASQIPLDYTFKVETLNGEQDDDAGTIPVDYYSYSRKKVEERPDQTISKFSLVVFSFNSPEISDHDKSILEKNVIPAIKANSTVQIYGYTDRIGNEDYNQKLALQRATNAKKFLQSKLPDVKYEVYGVGEEVEVYDNNSPVGRQLSRTVQIYVITPKN